jgi:hypothetical protein
MDAFTKIAEAAKSVVDTAANIKSRDDLLVEATDKFIDLSTDAKNADKVGSLVKLFGKAATAKDLTRSYKPDEIAAFCKAFVEMSGLQKKEKAKLEQKGGPVSVKIAYAPYKTISLPFGKSIQQALPAVPLKVTLTFTDGLIPEVSSAHVALDV